jgi:long-chain acyl-CoA synthetase
MTVHLPQSSNDQSETNVGVALPGVEVKVTADNEIAFKGSNAFSGYYGDVESTQSAMVDGWVHTGDIGGMVDDQLHILERSDCISKFANGADFLPKQIENSIKASPFIKDAFVVGEDKDFISALVVIDGDTVGAWAELRQMQFTGFRDLSTKDEVLALIMDKIKDVNASIERIGGKNCPHIKRFTILNKEFSISAGEMTRTRKIKRDVVSNNYQDLIEALFSEVDHYDVMDSSGELAAQLRIQTA